MTGSGTSQEVHTSDVTSWNASADVRCLYSQKTWNGDITYSFPTAESNYTAGYSSLSEVAGANTLVALSSAQQATVETILANYIRVLDLGLTEVTEADAGPHARVRYGITTDATNTTAWAYFPGTSITSGDVWYGAPFRSGGAYNGDVWYNGTYAYITSMHETGHALGLKHPHSTSSIPTGSGAMDTAVDCVSHTVMSYRSYIGSGTGSLSVAYGNYPQTLMAMDVEALQSVPTYDPSTADTSGGHVFSWDSTGAMFRDAAQQTAPVVSIIHCLVWDAGANNIVDVSNWNPIQAIDLNRFSWSTVDAAYLAALGGAEQPPGNFCTPYTTDPFSIVMAGSGGGTYAFNTNLSTNKIVLDDIRAHYLWDGAGNDWTGTNVETDAVYECTDLYFVSFSDEADIPVAELEEGEPPPDNIHKTLIWTV